MTRSSVLEQLSAMRSWLNSQGVSRIALFGSHARDEAGPLSDVDLVVEFAPGRTPDLFSFAGLKVELETRLGATLTSSRRIRSIPDCAIALKPA
jgi:predicted nucleotidyltransferase